MTKVLNGYGYLVVKHKPVCDCDTTGTHSEEYDAYFCTRCNKWLEPECGCPPESGCPVGHKVRPEKPVL